MYYQLILLTMLQKVRFHLNIPYDLYLAYYSGAAQNISVVALDGRRIQFPAKHVQRFLTHSGIIGTFEMTFNGSQMVDFQKIA